jgi:hypothetical protein
VSERADVRTDYATAARGYDPEFRDELTKQIVTAIAETSIVTDSNLMVLRVGETCDALALALVSMMALSPQFDTPSRLREAAFELAKKVRRDVARARADPTFAVDIMGARRGGTA